MILLEFPHSHYCEKARWALDHKGVSFQPTTVLPGFHMVTVRKFAPKSSVPVLLDGREVIQGSSEIIDYLDFKYPSSLLTPSDQDERQVCLGIEKDSDKRLGENIRRILYYYLLCYPDYIRHCFTHSLPRSKQLVFRLIYPLLRKKIYQTYVISPSMVKRARKEFDVAMDGLLNRLKMKKYLVGQRFSRADLSVASMLSLLVLPSEHPFPWREIPDPQLRMIFDEYDSHPVSEWARNIYRDHRYHYKSS